RKAPPNDRPRSPRKALGATIADRAMRPRLRSARQKARETLRARTRLDTRLRETFPKLQPSRIRSLRRTKARSTRPDGPHVRDRGENVRLPDCSRIPEQAIDQRWRERRARDRGLALRRAVRKILPRQGSWL